MSMGRDLLVARKALQNAVAKSGHKPIEEIMNSVRSSHVQIREASLRTAVWSLVSEGKLDLDQNYHASTGKVAAAR